MTTNVTPYMHVLVNHMHESLALHGSLSNFSQQGLEKLNDRVTGWFFKLSNHKGVEALRLIMVKQNRLELLEEKYNRDLKFKVTCTKCKGVAHNMRTCVTSKEL
ncbi:hypothetical protein HOLleu_03165 [Holothuria leucospilota]|uniref:Uncharacterized protein n=1 Tax=Holothuria leucospilota TaxID=206669 RepID=A0A9Q1CS79_HOLLE|nr:hypothetical protein HOLleu_03165 [Holothuria leucospilota]